MVSHMHLEYLTGQSLKIVATVAELVRRQTYDLRVIGSSPGWVCYTVDGLGQVR